MLKPGKEKNSGQKQSFLVTAGLVAYSEIKVNFIILETLSFTIIKCITVY